MDPVASVQPVVGMESTQRTHIFVEACKTNVSPVTMTPEMIRPSSVTNRKAFIVRDITQTLPRSADQLLVSCLFLSVHLLR